MHCLEGRSRDEDVDAGEERSEGALAPQLHFHVNEEVLRLAHLAVQVDGARVGVELARAEVVPFVAPRDADDDVVSGVGRRWPDTEDLCRYDGVCLEAQLVVGDPQRRVLALDEVGATDPLTPSVTEQNMR